uniref:Pco147721a n=1 Tax=Arundo donax TaxID=35708 RepID=A0A0A9HFC7_ARUDO
MLHTFLLLVPPPTRPIRGQRLPLTNQVQPWATSMQPLPRCQHHS